MCLTKNNYENLMFYSSHDNNLEMTSYIIEKGGDINFKFNWCNDFWPLSGHNKGTTMDYVLYIKYKCPNKKNVSKLIELLLSQVNIYFKYFKNKTVNLFKFK